MSTGVLLCSFLSLLVAVCCLADAPPAPDSLVLENEWLRMEVSADGARIVSLIDKPRGEEQAKMLPFIGGLGEVRFNGVINHNDLRDRYALTLDNDATEGPTITAVTIAAATEDNPVAATVTKRYTLVPDAGRIQCELTLRNDGEQEFALMPWVRHLLRRGLEAQPEEAHMTPYGAFLSGKPVPGRPDLNPGYDHHHFPATNWTSRVTMPLGRQSNTLVSILPPAELLKVYNWHRSKEDFCTQEFIAAPLFLAPGQTQTLRYELVVAAPVRNIVYASPGLIVGATPHPTGIAIDARQLELSFAAPAAVTSVQVTAVLTRVDAPTTALHTETFTLHDLGPSSVIQRAVPIELTDGVNYQMHLTFARDDAPWWPGQQVNDSRPVVIPLVPGKPQAEQVVYPATDAARDRLLQIKQRHVPAPRVARNSALDVFALNAGMRIFPEDRCVPQDDADPALRACRNEYESMQLVLFPQAGAPAEIHVAADDLIGPDGSRVRCESVNRLLEVKTVIPSRYNASLPVGTYREGLLPTQALPLAEHVNVPLVVTYYVPEDAAPGRYHGQVRLGQGDSILEVPVEMEVWHVTLPRANPWMDTPASLKGLSTGGVVVHGGDGQPMTGAQLLEATVDMHLKYRLTPCDAGITRDLLTLNFDRFEPIMQSYVDRGATMIYLGSIPQLLAQHSAQLEQVETYLKEKGWIGHFYVRPGFDEASPDLLEQMRVVCARWKAVSSIPVMETYYHAEPNALFDMLDIYCRSVSDEPWVRRRMAAGDRFWKVNAFPQHVEIEPWTIRRQYLIFWEARFTGTYLWTIKQWHGVTKWYEDFWCDGGVGNLSATLIWPHETGLLSSLGLEALRDAIEDNALFWMLREKLGRVNPDAPLTPEQRRAMELARNLCQGDPFAAQITDMNELIRLRRQAGEALSVLNASNIEH